MTDSVLSAVQGEFGQGDNLKFQESFARSFFRVSLQKKEKDGKYLIIFLVLGHDIVYPVTKCCIVAEALV